MSKLEQIRALRENSVFQLATHSVNESARRVKRPDEHSRIDGERRSAVSHQALSPANADAVGKKLGLNGTESRPWERAGMSRATWYRRKIKHAYPVNAHKR